MRVARIFPEFQLCIGWGEGELQENFEKDALFYEGIQKLQKIVNTTLLSQGLLSRIEDSRETHPFKVNQKRRNI